MMKLLEKKLISQAAYFELHEKGSFAINTNAPSPFESIVEAVIKAGIPASRARSEFELSIATSSATSYLQLGRPESIVLDKPERISRQMEMMARASTQQG
jgi:hypothetical protein